jgi:hypothetical protein
MQADLSRAIEVWIRSLARSEILAAAGTADRYSSRGPLPADASARTFRDACRRGHIADAEKIGKVWFCSRAAWHAARARRPTAPALRVVEALPSDEQRADAMIRAAGFRLTRGAR